MARLPLVAVACMCEKVLREEDGVLSAIRIVDRFQARVTGAPEGTVVSVPLTALISLKAGEFEGKAEMTLKLRTPTGKVVDLPEAFPFLLKGPEQGANLIVQMQLPAKDFGLYGLDVYVNQQILTSIPFKLIGPDEPLRAEI